MTIAIKHIDSPTFMDPRIRRVLEIEPYTAVLIVFKSGKNEFIRDVILRTGSTGWQRTGDASGRQYLSTHEIENFLSELLDMHPGVSFHTAQASA